MAQRVSAHNLVVRRDLVDAEHEYVLAGGTVIVTSGPVVERWRRTSTFKGDYVLAAVYGCTIGAEGHETPGGQFAITEKTRTPDWLVPDSVQYERDARGALPLPRVVPWFLPDTSIENRENPFAGGFITIGDPANGVGFHGTKFDPLLGTAASHGCVRMLLPDLDELFAKVAKGTPVYIV